MNQHAVAEPREDELGQIARDYVDLVYAAALRRMGGDAAGAADVTQAVMLVLIHKGRAGKLPEERYMAGWLLKVTGYAVMQETRAAARRARHEREAGRRGDEATEENESHTDVRAVLDESLLTLGAVDREAVARRYLRGQSVAEVAEALGMRENTAGRRIARALEKLRKTLLRRGISAPIAAVAAVMGVEAAVKAPPACAALTPATATVELAKNISWKLAMVKIKAAAMIALGTLILAATGTAIVIAAGGKGNGNPTPAPAPVTPAAWSPEPISIAVAKVIDGPSDADLKEILAGLLENQRKLHVIHVQATATNRIYDPAKKTWTEMGQSEGQAWMASGNQRLARAEVAHDRSRSISIDQTGFGPAKDASYVETWNGTTTLREYRPPFSTPEAETFNQRYLKGDQLLGADFSMQLPWDEETSQNLQGSHKTIDRNPLDPAVLSKLKLSARKVTLGAGADAMELTVTIPDGIGRVETFWFDPKHGYGLLARQNVFSIGGQEVRKQTLVIKSMAEAAPGIFYPNSAAMLWEERGNPFIREEFTASAVPANEPVDAATFQLQFPKGIEVIDFKDGIGTKRR